MNSTSQNPEHTLSSGPDAMNNTTLYITLAVAAGIVLLCTLLIYVSNSGRNPLSRLPYGLFVSGLPALGTLVVVKLTRLFVSWRGVATVYLLLLFLVMIVQTFGR